MMFFAVASWVVYTSILLIVLWYGFKKRRVALIVFATIAVVITSLRQPLFFLGLAAPHPQNHFSPQEWELITLANIALIFWVTLLTFSYRFNRNIAPIVTPLFPHRDPNPNIGRRPKGIFWVILPPFLVSVCGTAILINQFGGLSQFAFAVKISKDLAGSYAVRAVGAVACAMAMYGVLASLQARDPSKSRLPLIVYVYSAMVFIALATVFAWGNRYTLALVLLSFLLSWHFHVRRIQIFKLILILLAAGMILQGLKYVRLGLVADALGRDVSDRGHDFWLSLSLSLHFVEFDAFLLSLRDAGTQFEFRWAKDFINGLLAWVPRSIYPEKETFHIGGWFRQVYEPWTVNGWPITTPGSWYVNFAIPGIFIGAWISGFIMRGFDLAFSRLDKSPWQAATAPFLGFFLFEAGVSMGLVQSWFLYALPIYLASVWLAYMSSQRAKIRRFTVSKPT